ncbi:hypothetical protein CLF_109897 [Clonorchis sinensis]|uniref:Uncharacterized protein n=1 Tax=Clonorchis sinensis TaxID=79923 RepID=G7YT16_CLOSI|nr:hypothetical protein CLF_109897 [Clonorchis sinensis]
MGGRFGVDDKRTDNSKRLLQMRVTLRVRNRAVALINFDFKTIELIQKSTVMQMTKAAWSHLTRPNEHWISSRSAHIIAARNAIPAFSDYGGARTSLKHRIIRSLENDRDFEAAEDDEGFY